MKRPEVIPVVEKLIHPFKKENVLTDALVDFERKYSSQLMSSIKKSGEQAFDVDVVEEHIHALNCIHALTQTTGELTIVQKAQLWWCAEDLIIHLRMYQPELVDTDQELFDLLQVIKHLLEPSFPKLSKNDRREKFYITWFRKKFELKNSIGPESVNGGLNTLDRWIGAITEFLEVENPTIAQNQMARWAAGGLLEVIVATNNPSLIEFIPLLKQIRRIAR